MNKFQSNNDFSKSNKILAISVGHVTQGFLHNKILYNFDETVGEIHLGWHHHFFHEKEIISPDSYIWKVPNLPDSRLKSVVAKCLLVAENQKDKLKNQLPYSVGYFSGREFNQDGIYTDNISGYEYGMTCATFVLTIFNSVGIELLDWRNWKYREDDKPWFNYIILNLTKGYSGGYISKTHLDNVKKEENCARFRPEEIFASMYCSHKPSSKFSCTSNLGSLVKPFVLQLPEEHNNTI